MAVEADDWEENRTEGGEEVKALFALVLSGLVLCGCNPRPYDYISEGDKKWIIRIEQLGLFDISFSTNDPDCVRTIRKYKADIYGYLVTKPDGEELFISGTARITRKEVKK